MKIINQSVEILTSKESILEQLKICELAGRVCYKSEDSITEDSYKKFLKMIFDRGHHSVLEHCNISVKFITDRGISHEIVRHRIASYSQESTRYCNYSKTKFNNELTFIKPYFESNVPIQEVNWEQSMEFAEASYRIMLRYGAKPEEARSVLPNSLKTELIMTANLREWLHFIKLRGSKQAHPQMRELVNTLKTELVDKGVFIR
jgi:thymidylate synthase (FAD)